MPRPPNLEVRERLLTIGRDVVLERGFNGCGVGDITEAVGVPKGSFYNYFESKEAFAAEILEAYWSSIEVRHGPVLKDARAAPLVRIRNFFRAVSKDHAQRNYEHGCLIGNLSLELANGSESARHRLLDVLSRWEAGLTACLKEAQKRGEWPSNRDAKDIAALLIEAYEGAVLRTKVERSGKAFSRFEKVVLPLLLG